MKQAIYAQIGNREIEDNEIAIYFEGNFWIPKQHIIYQNGNTYIPLEWIHILMTNKNIQVDFKKIVEIFIEHKSLKIKEINIK